MKNNTLTQMEQAIWNVLKGRRNVSFVNLCQKVPGFYGDMRINLPPYNMLLWNDISPEAAAALKKMLGMGLIECDPVSPLIYLLEGVTFNLPIATEARPYKELHWLPIVINLTRKGERI